MVFVTGDIHGDPTRFSTDIFPEQKEMTKDDFCIVCGDFGIIWNYLGEDNNEKYWLKYLDNKPFTTLFCCGNHENFDRLYQYPVVDFHGGKAHKISDSVYHLIRGEIFDLQGKKFFVFGGASSHDIRDGILEPEETEKIKRWRKDYGKMFRVNHVSWWKEELPSEEEMQNGIKNLEKHNWEVDFVISHCAPQQVASVFSHGLYKSDILTTYFDDLLNRGLKFSRWFFGHYHDNRQIMSKFIMLYEQIVRIL